MPESSTPRLMAAAKEFEIGKDTLVDFLIGKGFNRDDLKPTAKLSEEMYRALQLEFQNDKVLKLKSDEIDLSAPSEARKKKEEEPALFRLKEDLITLPIILKERGLHPAHELTEKCLKDKSPYLDLGNCGLSSADFAPGSFLDKMLRQCSHLKSLILSNSWWIWTEREGWQNVRSKNIGNANVLIELPDALKELASLSKLICCGDMGSAWDIRNLGILANLSNLVHLDIRDNEISQLDPLKNLGLLKILFASRNRIKDLTPLKNLKSLFLLDIDTNRVESMTGIEGLSSLKILDIHNNWIREVVGLDALPHLQKVYLSRNEIEDLNGLDFIIEKEKNFYVEIDENPLTATYQLKLRSHENHLPFLKEILLREMDKSAKGDLKYPVKVLMLGNHSSGKSSLVNYLSGKAGAGSTHILRIENYFVGKIRKPTLPDAIFFDFGGQDFYHGLYQAFISTDALQIILFDARNDLNKIGKDVNDIPIINFNRKYWLGQKRYQEKNGQIYDPYVMVQSYADVDIVDADQINYSMFRGYQKSFNLSFRTDLNGVDKADQEFYNSGREYFKAYFNSLIHKMRTGREEPTWYIRFLEYIINKEDKTHASTPLAEILKHYEVKDLPDAEKLASLKTNLTTLHRHGLVLYYPQTTELEDIVWLDPQKLVEHVQQHLLNKSLMDASKYKVPGVIPKREFEEMVNDKQVLFLLQVQKVIFLHSPTKRAEDEEYIIPNYLPLIDKTESDFQLFTFGLNSPDFIIKFEDFIPFGFINQMICFFGKQPDVKKFWRNQVLFTLQRDARVLIELDFAQLKIKVHCQMLKSSTSNAELIREYLFYCVMGLYWNVGNDKLMDLSEFVDLKANDQAELTEAMLYWADIRFDAKFVPEDAYISLDDERYVKYFDLFNIPLKEFRIASYGLKDGRIDGHDRKEIAAGPFRAFTSKNISIMKKIFVSYSKYDEDYLQEFEDHLVTLKQEGVATFECRKIEFGKEWDDEIKKQIKECDIMVCLISVKFLNSDYINKIEVPLAIEKNKTIVPIIIKACDWENSTLGKYQAAKRGNIVSLDNQSKLDGKIKSYTPEERAAFWTEIVREFRTKLLVP